MLQHPSSELCTAATVAHENGAFYERMKGASLNKSKSESLRPTGSTLQIEPTPAKRAQADAKMHQTKVYVRL